MSPVQVPNNLQPGPGAGTIREISYLDPDPGEKIQSWAGNLKNRLLNIRPIIHFFFLINTDFTDYPNIRFSCRIFGRLFRLFIFFNLYLLL